jgi:hypothetical protein
MAFYYAGTLGGLSRFSRGVSCFVLDSGSRTKEEPQ